MLLVALHRAKQKDILISMYENDIENSHIGVMRPVQVRARACARARLGAPPPRSPWSAHCACAGPPPPRAQPGMFVLEGRRAGVRADPPWEYTCIAHGTHQTGDMPVMNMMEVAVPNCAYGESAFANGHNAPPSPSAAVAWPPGELERWLREHDDTQPQRDASLLTMRLPQWNPVRARPRTSARHAHERPTRARLASSSAHTRPAHASRPARARTHVRARARRRRSCSRSTSSSARRAPRRKTFSSRRSETLRSRCCSSARGQRARTASTSWRPSRRLQRLGLR